MVNEPISFINYSVMEGLERLMFAVLVESLKYFQNINKSGFIIDDNDLEMEPESA